MIIGSIVVEYLMLIVSIVYQVTIALRNYKKEKVQDKLDKSKGIDKEKQDGDWFIVYRFIQTRIEVEQAKQTKDT